MHIALVSPAWPVGESANGIVTYVHHLRTELLNQGHRVSVFANELGAHRDTGVYRVAPTLAQRVARRFAALGGERSAGVPGWGRAIGATIDAVNRADPIDIVEMEESFGWCAQVRESVALPLVVRLHGPAFLTLSEEAARIELEGEALRASAALVSPSRVALRCTTQRYRFQPPIARVIPNPLRSDAPRWELEGCERKTLLFVGRFDRLKGGDTALLAFRRLLDADPELKLVFVGPDAGGRFEEFCDTLFTPAQRNSVQFLGRLPAGEIGRLRTRAMATLVLSRWETQGYTALEAMAQGCPLIVTDAGALTEVVHHGSTGLVARLDDIDDLCAQVRRVLDDPLAAREMGRNAQRFVAEHHSPRAIAERALELYAEVISR